MSGREIIRISPVNPSTSTIVPFVSPQARGTETTAGIPYSRAMMELWERIPPDSATTAPARAKSGVRPTSGIGDDQDIAVPEPSYSCIPRMTRAGPLYRPRDVGIP